MSTFTPRQIAAIVAFETHLALPPLEWRPQSNLCLTAYLPDTGNCLVIKLTPDLDGGLLEWSERDKTYSLVSENTKPLPIPPVARFAA